MGGLLRTVATVAAVAIGGWVGAGVNLAFGLLFPAKQPKTGIASQKLEVNTSEFDGPIPDFWGTMGKIGGNIINVACDKDGKPAGVLTKTKKKKVSGKGGSSQTVKEKTFFLVCEVSVGASGDGGPLFIDKLEVEQSSGIKVWWNRYNDDPDPNYTYTPEYGPSGALIAEIIEEGPRKLTLQLGTEEQQPLAFLEEFHGVGNVCPHRGVATIGINRAEIEAQPTFIITVRSETTGRREIIRKRLQDCGIPDARISLTQITGSVEGAAAMGREPARDLCEKLASRVMCGFAFNNARVEDYSKENPHVWTLQDSDLAARPGESNRDPDAGGEIYNKTPFELKGEEEFQSEVSASFYDLDNNYEENTAIAPRLSAQHSNPQSYDIPEAAHLGDVLAWTRAMLDEDWAADRTLKIAVLPKHCQMVPGNVMSVPHRKTNGGTAALDYIITEQGIDPSGLLTFQGVPWRSGLHEQAGIVTEGERPVSEMTPLGKFYYQIFDIAPLHDDHTTKPGFYVLACWADDVDGVEFGLALSGTGLVTGYSSAGGSTNAFPTQGTFGIAEGVLGDFTGDTATEWDDSSLVIKLRGEDGVEDETDAAILAGYVNLLRIGDEILQFVHATYLGEADDGEGGVWQRYEISRFKRARRATEWALATHGEDEPVSLLDNALLRVELAGFAVGQEIDYQFIVGDRMVDASYTCDGVSLKPFSVSMLQGILTGADWMISFVPRTRFMGWEINPAVPILTAPPDTDSFALEILDEDENVMRTIAAANASTIFVPYLEADQVEDFGSAQETIRVRALRLSSVPTPAAESGRGYTIETTFEGDSGAPPVTSQIDIYELPAQSVGKIIVTGEVGKTITVEWSNGTPQSRDIDLETSTSDYSFNFGSSGARYMKVTGDLDFVHAFKVRSQPTTQIDGLSALIAGTDLDFGSGKLAQAAIEAQIDACHAIKTELGANGCVLRWTGNPGTSAAAATRTTEISELETAGCTVNI